jgi:hypothetical protein
VTEKGDLSRRAAARDVASKLGLPPNEVYQILLEAKKSAE